MNRKQSLTIGTGISVSVLYTLVFILVWWVLPIPFWLISYSLVFGYGSFFGMYGLSYLKEGRVNKQLKGQVFNEIKS